MHQAITALISTEDYLTSERRSEIRHEYLDGYLYAMAGAGEKHNTISLNLAVALRPAARARGCKLFIADMKLRIQHLNRFYYPDLLLTCDPADRHEFYKDTPCLLVEVLSPSTETTDRREKLMAYQSIPSLREYLMVAQDSRQIEIHRREGAQWRHIILTDDDPVYLDCLGLELTMAAVYEDVLAG
ncbi:MAG: Uma2 family endonuclease [Thiothrix sp.]|nr:Uma2 family endonuclease [Thiothrix sp.]HPE58924.1 Uma2 family endonuclease [Thiolinea sp.]